MVINGTLRWLAVGITDTPATAWRRIHPPSAWIHSAVIVYPLCYCWNPLCPGLNRPCSCPNSLFFRLNSPLTTHIYSPAALNLQRRAGVSPRMVSACACEGLSTTFPYRIPKLSLRYPPKRTNGHFRWTNGQIWRPPRPGTWRSRFLSHWGVNKFDTSDCAGIGRLIG